MIKGLYLCVLTATLAAQPGDLRAQEPRALSPRNANYRIDATLDHARHEIDGHETITWRNPSARPAESLRFHLYYNAWRDDRSTWMRERQLAGIPIRFRADDDRGWTNITSLKIARVGAASIDTTNQLHFVAPDDGNAEDRTVVEAPLQAPVAPGETITIDVAWTAHVPRPVARTGVIGSYYFVGQWFPKIGVLQDSGWNCHQFHSTTEFFSDFGVYDVRLTVPSGWIVGATGIEQDAQDQPGGRRTHHFYQADVHDFAWTTSPEFLERHARFEHPTLPSADIRLLLQPEHAGQEERHFAAARATLRDYGEWFGPYPYGHLTIVDPAWSSSTGGMEYPTLITAGSHWIAPSGVTQPEGVTVHEAGHQFWYGIVATNEFEDAWMDEGFNTYSTARVIEQAFTPNYTVERYFGGFIPWVFRDLPQTRVTDDRLAGYRGSARRDVQATPSFRYWPGSAGAITYNKTALWLHTLERHLGWPVLQRVLSTYFGRYAFSHPHPQDFFDVAHTVSGRDLGWFFDQVYRGSQVFDYGIDVIRSNPEGSAYRTSVVARRYADGVFPITVRATFADGGREDWQWDGRDQWKLFETIRTAPLVSAEADPDRVLLLDVNRTNNSAVLQSVGRKAARRWSFTWLVWLQDQLLTYGFFV
jgi:aminopeptidase N